MNCKYCNKKLNKLMEQLYTCKCNNLYCREHMIQHNCSYDYKKIYSDIIKINNPLIVSDKITKI